MVSVSRSRDKLVLTTVQQKVILFTTETERTEKTQDSE